MKNSLPLFKNKTKWQYLILFCVTHLLKKQTLKITQLQPPPHHCILWGNKAIMC